MMLYSLSFEKARLAVAENMQKMIGHWLSSTWVDQCLSSLFNCQNLPLWSIKISSQHSHASFSVVRTAITPFIENSQSPIFKLYQIFAYWIKKGNEHDFKIDQKHSCNCNNLKNTSCRACLLRLFCNKARWRRAVWRGLCILLTL